MEMLQIVRADGQYDSKLEPDLRDDDLRKMYMYMLKVRRFNERMLLLQRQGRISFFIESNGEEACQIGSAFALTGGDWVYLYYRDPGSAWYRGVSMKTLIDQLMANADDPNKGRQMGAHWGYRDRNIVSLSSPSRPTCLRPWGRPTRPSSSTITSSASPVSGTGRHLRGSSIRP